MMTVLPAILKISGLILLAILGLVILVLCYVLFAPFGYSVRGEFYDDISVRVQLRDLLGIVRVKVSYARENGLGWGVHLFGMKKAVFPRTETAEDAAGIENTAEKPAAGNTTDNEKPDNTADNEKSGNTADNAKAGNAAEKRESGSESKTARNEESCHDKSSAKPDTPQKRKKNKSDKNDDHESAVGKFLRLAGDESTHRVLRFLTGKLIKLIKIIAPKRLEADLEYSTGEPDLTGELTGVLAMCPAAYGKKVSLIPDFSADNAYARGYIELSGSVRLSSIVGIALSILFNKDCRKLWKEVK